MVGKNHRFGALAKMKEVDEVAISYDDNTASADDTLHVDGSFPDDHDDGLHGDDDDGVHHGDDDDGVHHGDDDDEEEEKSDGRLVRKIHLAVRRAPRINYTR